MPFLSLLFFFPFQESPFSVHQIEYLKGHIKPISSEKGGGYDWAPFLNEVKGRDVVALGEFTHGAQEIFDSRNSLIKELHQKLGFDLILFESGLGEVGAVYRDWNQVEDSKLTSGFFFGWRNAAFLELMLYARERNLTVAGFDVQRTGSVFTNRVGAASFTELESRFVALKAKLSSYRTQASTVRSEYDALTKMYATEYDQLNDTFERRVIKNRLTYLNYMYQFCVDKDWSKRWAARDEAMADNVIWILQQNPDRKAIIIGHNYHISRHNPKEQVMGEVLAKRFGKQLYVLGVFAGAGSIHNNAGKREVLSEPDLKKMDLKHLALQDGYEIGFLSLPSHSNLRNQWLFEPMIANDTFIDLSKGNRLTLTRWFDGVLLIDHVTPPQEKS